jgi:hypothetical protein
LLQFDRIAHIIPAIHYYSISTILLADLDQDSTVAFAALSQKANTDNLLCT